MTTDTKGAEAFYQRVVGWTRSAFEGGSCPNAMFGRSRGTTTVAGVIARPETAKAPPSWAMYIRVPEIEDAASKISSLGGEEGASFYIVEPSSADQRPEKPAEIGEASWYELLTTDPASAMAFDQQVFGWQPSEVMDMGPMGTYQMFGRVHGMIGAITKKPRQWRTCRPTGRSISASPTCTPRPSA